MSVCWIAKVKSLYINKFSGYTCGDVKSVEVRNTETNVKLRQAVDYHPCYERTYQLLGVWTMKLYPHVNPHVIILIDFRFILNTIEVFCFSKSLSITYNK